MDHFLSGLDGHNSPWHTGRAVLHSQTHEFAVGTNSFQLIPISGSVVTSGSSGAVLKNVHGIDACSSAQASSSKILSAVSHGTPIMAHMHPSAASSRMVKEEVEDLSEQNISHLGLEGYPIGHMKSSSKNKDITGKKADTRRACNICGKVLSRGDKLKNHIRIHTNNFPYHCDTCGQGFLRSEGLRIHTRIHTGERPYVCIVCGKAYTRKDKLTRHAIVHTGERPFVCHQCGKSFTRKDKMQRHELIHKVEKPWTCVPCNLEFVRQEGFNAHMEKKHPERLPYTLIRHSRPIDSPPSPGYLIHEDVGVGPISLSPIAHTSKSSLLEANRSVDLSAVANDLKTSTLLTSRIPTSLPLPHPQS